jgi:phage terminase Nu1 subunit (DNA packaging protein)
MNEDLTDHKKRMLEHLTNKKKKRRIPPLPVDKEDKVFTLELAPRYELDKELIRKRIEATSMRTMAYAMDIARTREELIEKKLVEKQLAFLLVALRQKITSIPTSYARKLIHIEDIKDVHRILQEMVFRLLDDIKNLPIQVTDPNWLANMEEEEDASRK